MTNPSNPHLPQPGDDVATMPVPTSIALRLACIAVHVLEHASPDGHEFDLLVARGLANDEVVRAWLRSLGPLVPVPRIPGLLG